MADIRHRVGISAPQSLVYDAVATTNGVAQWWTRTVDGDATVGGSLAFRFGSPEPRVTMEIVDLTPNQRVDWRYIQGPDEWVGTNLRFELQGSENETVLLFTHADWREPVEFMHHCSTKWALFLLSIKAGLEGGTFTPYPDDPKISSWG